MTSCLIRFISQNDTKKELLFGSPGLRDYSKTVFWRKWKFMVWHSLFSLRKITKWPNYLIKILNLWESVAKKGSKECVPMQNAKYQL